MYSKMNDQERKKWEEDNIRGAFQIMNNLLDETRRDRDYYKRMMDRLQQEVLDLHTQKKKLTEENQSLREKLYYVTRDRKYLVE